MARDINDIVNDRVLDVQSDGEQYRETFLAKRPKAEWSPYIDETAKDLSAGIQIGDLALSKNDFGQELGAYYRRGLEQAAGRYADLPNVLESQVSDSKLGLLAYQLNELSYDIATTDLGIDDVGNATEAVIEKLLTRHAGGELDVSFELSGGTVADISTQLFENEAVAANVDVLLGEFEESAAKGLLPLMDEPQMMTPLWDHQRDALEAWVGHDYRGYVDMATATGKTVLGLGALALQYGELHPDDQDIDAESGGSTTTGRDDVLIVAHSDLILEQWRREFDRHLNIPQERTAGSDDITLEWGTIHFRTPQALVNEDRVDYDLVLLDEAHHYATGSEWGSLLDEFDGNVLAMSGSVDDAGSDSGRIKDRLSNSIGPEVMRYTITDARADGVIPSFDWEVHYAPYDTVGDDLQKVSTRAERAFRGFQQQLDSGEINVETDRSLNTYEDLRRFSHTTEGSELKQRSETFRDLVTRLFSRRTKQWNLSPVLDAVVDLVVEHGTTENVVVLADSNAQVEELESRLTDVVADPDSLYRVAGAQSRDEQRETIDAFDQPESAGVLVGTGDLLGEGVDMQHASVAINMATGGVNPELVQRIGRVLRNPADTPKHAMFYNVVGVPPTEDAAIPREDGKGLIEQAAGFCSLGSRFDKLPGFATAASTDADLLGSLLEEGAAFIEQLDADGAYEGPGDTTRREDLDALLAAIDAGGDTDTILGEWEEYAWEHSEDEPVDPETADPDDTDAPADDAEQPADPAPDEPTLSTEQRDRVADIVRLQPTKNAELKREWSLDSGRAVARYLRSSLSTYYFRDAESLIWASDEAEALIDDDPAAPQDSTPEDDVVGDDAPPESKAYTREDVLTGLRNVAETVDGAPSVADINDHAPFSASAVYTHFDSLSDAREAAGVADDRDDTRERYTEAEIRSGLQDVAAEVDRPPRTDDINDYAPFSASAIYTHFRSLSAAREAADVAAEPFGSSPEPEPEERTDPEARTDSEEPIERDTSIVETDSDTTDRADEPEQDDPDETDQFDDESTAREQEIFWDRDVDLITEYGDEDAEESPTEPSGTGDTLDRKIDEWKSQLLDLTRRNKLIAFKPTKTKSLPFERIDPTAVATELDDGGELFLRKRPEADDDEERPELPELDRDELLPTRVPAEAANSLSQIGRKNKQYLRERGVDSLYLSLGMLRWYSVDHSDEANRSPLFLAPVELEEATQKDGERHDYVLKPKSEGLRLNPALRKKLAAERGIELPADGALSLERIDAAFASVHDVLQGFDRWTIQQAVVLGIFDFTKFSLYSDLERNRSAVKNDTIVRALNGDTDPLQEAEGGIETPTADELDDTVDPIDTYQVLDADSSQQEAIEAAKRGKSFVLQGPPGTGKSQTIANIIAEKLAAGERVLFVSEKQAALNVVKNRLDDVGVGRFCLEVHGEKATNADVLSALEDELRASQIKSPGEREQKLRQLRERRSTINEYGDQLFYSPDGWDLTAYQAFGIVSEHTDVDRIDIGIDDPLGTDQEAVREAVDELETLARFGDEIEHYESSPWRHTTLSQWGVDTADSMRRSLDRQLTALDELRETAATLSDRLGIRPNTLSEFRAVDRLLDYLADHPDIRWQESFFDESFAQEGSRFEELAELEQERESLESDLSANYERSFFSADGASLNDELAEHGFLKALKPSYRSLKRKITNHAREGYDPSHDQLLEDTRRLAELQRIEERRDDYRGVIQRLGPLYQGGDTDWETLSKAREWVSGLDTHDAAHAEAVTEQLLDGTLPDVDTLGERTGEVLAQYDDAAAFFERSMAVDAMRVEGDPFREASLAALQARLETLHDEVPNLQQRVQFSAQLERVRETVAGEYVDRFLDGEYDSGRLVAAFEKRFYTEWLNGVYERTSLSSFNADEMERYVEEFRRLDREQQELAKVQIQHAVTRRRPSLSLEHASSAEQVLVRRETEKQRRHKPLRELFDEAGSFITQLTPCFMMSPLSVAQYLKSGSIQFDTVVFDEASQIMPQDAVSSLIRADQAIIAGDTKQLPPTSFFQSDVETTEDVREDLDSILEETASVLPEKDLRWHYRSRAEELIQFSNYHYYNNRLRTFPENSPDVETGVEFDYVADGVYDRGGSRQNEVEAQRVVDLIEEHAEEHGEKSLGVVAFSSAQEQAIRDAIEERREKSAVLDAFVGQDDVLDEFFVKNLEMVQGDERDRMIFSVGYGPDQDGTISMNFGPLNKSGGERRLNVAVTRSRERITVVSSIQPGEIDLTRTNSTGVAHFKNYLEYAQKGERALARDDQVTNTLDFDSQFEEAVYDALVAAGYDVVSQVQSSSYSIDLAIKHPDQPGKFVLGIECDGAAYHSSKTARDRDRTRQMVLEDLGWTMHRIWSPDWASNRDREIRKIREKVDGALDGRVGDSTGTVDVPSHEPEAIETGSKTDHEAITGFEEPSLEWDERYSPNEHGMAQATRNSIRDTVVQNGPIKYDTAMRTYLDVWKQSRAGKKIQRIFRNRVDDLVESGEIYEEGEFLWPAADELEFQVRVNTGTDSRSIDEVPVEEVARAIGLILREGGTMTPDDLVLETTRLFGYQRRGKRIEERIEDALSLLETEGLVDTAGRVSLVEGADPEAAILSRIYPSVPASEETDAPSDTGDGQQTESVENAESPLNSLFGHNDAGGQQTESEQNAELSLGSLFGGGDDRRLDELTALFENHLEREDPENHFVDLRFEKGGETDVYYQFLNGWHNITQLTDGEEATLEAVVDENDLTVEADGDAFVTVSGDSAEPADEALLCVRLLNSVFDVDLDDVESAAEHGDGHVGW